MRKTLKICNNCEKEALAAYSPFCSRRCSEIDLGRWLNESYAIPANDTPDYWGEDQD